jgi:hypothetical protein
VALAWPTGRVAGQAGAAGPGQGTAGAADPARSAEEAAVLDVVRRLFDGMRTRDEGLLRGVWHPEARLQTAGPGPDGTPGLRTTLVDDFVASVLASGAHLDEVTFDEVVHISGDLASVWAPYNLFVDGAFQHCGVDAIQMVRSAGGWAIHQLTDTRTRDGCDPDRRGGGG